MTRAYRYMIILHPDLEEGGYTVTVPSLPGVVTEAETIEEAISMGKEAIALHIEGLVAHGLAVPEEDTNAQALIVDVAA
ncbi:MAG TPA: type II toxin-antitoxin system HicB family antitoxin [Dehalococcoidia bacterium]|nr:type II toxin-antitoxin system HicB family antitoxin [Dehalococcoidia bacterium]